MSATEPKRFGLPLRYLTLIALIVAPAIGTIFSILLGALLGGSIGFNPFPDLGSSLLNGAFFGGVLGAIPALVFGVPVHTALLEKNETGPGPYVALFAGLGLVVMAVVSTFSGMATVFFTQPISIVLVSMIFLVIGSVSGLIFWLIRRPDRDTRAVTPISPPASPPA